MAMFSLCSNIESARLLTGMVENRPTCLSLHGPLSRPLKRTALALFVQECVSMATFACALGPTDLTTPEPSEVVLEVYFYALQAMAWESVDSISKEGLDVIHYKNNDK